MKLFSFWSESIDIIVYDKFIEFLQKILIMYLQTTNPEEMFFNEQADTFSLTATFQDNKLTIILKDFIDWVIYSK